MATIFQCDRCKSIENHYERTIEIVTHIDSSRVIPSKEYQLCDNCFNYISGQLNPPIRLSK
jgi:hypothetical protein